MSWRWEQAVVVVAVLLTMAVGFCVFAHDQAGGEGQAMAPDLCAGMLASSLALVLFAVPLVNGRLLLEPVRSVYGVSLHIPDPPPKSRSLA
jgi:hypothetical protein